MKKIIVVGSGGAGKSTFARKLGAALDIEVIHLDKIYWHAGWVKTPEDEWVEIIRQLVKRESWIMDGNFGGTREIRMQACDTVILLDTPRRVCLYRVLRRAMLYRNRSRPDMAAGCNERLDWDFIKWVWNYPSRAKTRVKAELERYRHKTVIVLRSKSDIDQFLANPY